ncbi:MAG: hypothetical protein LH468_08380 [Nocardioides sp.]|nr:hypothetical protein [Nocardioides sp.]
MRLTSLLDGRRRLLVAVVVALVTLVLSAGATVANGDPLENDATSFTLGAAVRGAADARVPAAAPVRVIVRSGTSAASPSLLGAQVHEQRSTQLQAAFQAMLQTQTSAPVTAEVDPRIDRASCALLGRTWGGTGCSRGACLTGHEYAKTGANAETCRIGGRRGASYGVEVDFRRCQALNRVWIGLLNYCASDPHRAETVVPDAPQCRAPYTSYVLLTEQDGGYDECLRPSRVTTLQATATATGRSVASVAAEQSRTQCGWRPAHVYLDGRCQEALTAPQPRVLNNVAVVGDSITWRGTNELATLQPDWVIDGSSGRQIDALDARLDAYRESWGEPGGVVLALGTNGRTGWREEQFRASIDRVPATTPILLVTPFREAGTTGRPELMDQYAEWFGRLAAERPLTCLADWRAEVFADRALLVDGVHPTTIGEVHWAEMIDNSWSSCLSRNAFSSF